MDTKGPQWKYVLDVALMDDYFKVFDLISLLTDS